MSLTASTGSLKGSRKVQKSNNFLISFLFRTYFLKMFYTNHELNKDCVLSS